MKVKKSEEQEGNYYIFGTKCLYVTEMDGGEILVVKEEKSHGGEMDFGAYVAKNKDEKRGVGEAKIIVSRSHPRPVKANLEVFENCKAFWICFSAVLKTCSTPGCSWIRDHHHECWGRWL